MYIYFKKNLKKYESGRTLSNRDGARSFYGQGPMAEFFFLVGTKYTKFLLLPYIF
jgi:hypothetical protein